MSTIIDRLLGRKKRTSVTISDELALQAAALADARNRISAAKKAREAALDALDKAGLRAATEARVEARNDVALAERAIVALQVAHEEALKAEAREAFRADVTAYNDRAAKAEKRLITEYPEAAARLSAMVTELSKLFEQRQSIEGRARDLGEAVQLRNPEAFRSGPRRWSVTYLNPNGEGLIQTDASSAATVHRWVNDEPFPLISWVDGEPAANFADVTVRSHSVDHPASLINAIGMLPGLHAGDTAVYTPPREEKLTFTPAEWQSPKA